MSWFGKKKTATPSTSDAIQRLQETEMMLQKKSDFLEAKIQQEMKTAKQAGMKNKRVALNALKRKKRLVIEHGIIMFFSSFLNCYYQL